MGESPRSDHGPAPRDGIVTFEFERYGSAGAFVYDGDVTVCLDLMATSASTSGGITEPVAVIVYHQPTGKAMVGYSLEDLVEDIAENFPDSDTSNTRVFLVSNSQEALDHILENVDWNEIVASERLTSDLIVKTVDSSQEDRYIKDVEFDLAARTVSMTVETGNPDWLAREEQPTITERRDISQG